jgi:hypothetical protein
MSFCMMIQNSRANYLLTVKGTSRSPATKLLVERIALYLKPTNHHRIKSSSFAMCAEHRSHPLDSSSWLAGVSKFEISQFGIFAFKVPGSRLCRFEEAARKALSKS